MTIPSRSDLALLGRWLRARVRMQMRTGRAVVTVIPVSSCHPFASHDTRRA